MAKTFIAPLSIAPDAGANMALSAEQVLQCPAPTISGDLKKLGCEIEVKIGVFFDGTSNNLPRDMPSHGHSNVARLFNAHKSATGDGPIVASDMYSIYVAGVGTKFEPNGEYTELAAGKSQGVGGHERVLFGVIRTLSTIYRSFMGDELYEAPATAPVLQRFRKEVLGGEEGTVDVPRKQRDQWLKTFTDEVVQKIEAARAAKPKPYIPRISVSVFGFSRGATEAAGFCHWFNAAVGSTGAIAGMPVEINFVGLFDTVSSVGIADSASRALGAPLHGFSGWAEETRKALPAMVKKVVHMVAANEQRMNFPLTRVKANTELEEYVYPGMHSDIGGGYGPKCQGRSPTDADLLSQVPLLHMYRHARAAGVPLLDHSQMTDALKDIDYSLSPQLAEDWNNYMASLDADYRAQNADTSIERCLNLHELVRAHMRLYYHFKRNHLHSDDAFRYLPGYPKAASMTMSPQENSLLRSYQNRLVGDVQLLCPDDPLTRAMDKKEPNFVLAAQVRNSQGNNRNRYPPQPPVRLPDQDWVDFAKGILGGQLPPEKRVKGNAHFMLIGRYMHDSLAGFALIGPLTNEDKAHTVVEVVEKHGKGEKLNETEQKIYDRYAKRAEKDERFKELVRDRVEKRKEDKGSNKKDIDDWWRSYYQKWAFEDKDADHVANNPSVNDRTKEENSITPVANEKNSVHWNVSFTDRQAIRIIAGDSLQEGGGYFLPRNIFE